MRMSTTKKTILNVAQILIGDALSAFAVACFALPYKMVVSGITGIGSTANYYAGFNISMTVLVINIGLFVLGFALLGKKFAATIVVGSFSFPVFLAFFEKMTMLHHLVNDPLLAAICAGILDGIGLGLIIRTGGSSGGIDVPPIILNRKLGWKIAPMMYMIDLAIFLIQLPFTSTNGIILGILYAIIYAVVMNKILVLDQGGAQIMIFSRENHKINEHLLKLGYGTTLIHTTSGYLRDEQEVVYCVVGSRNINRIKRETLGIDNKAFITISNVSEVNGNGFTLLLGDEDYNPDPEVRQDGGDIVKTKI